MRCVDVPCRLGIATRCVASTFQLQCVSRGNVFSTRDERMHQHELPAGLVHGAQRFNQPARRLHPLRAMDV